MGTLLKIGFDEQLAHSAIEPLSIAKHSIVL